MKSSFKYLLALSSCVALLNANQAHAGAWVQEKGHGQVITTYSQYATNAFFNRSGDRVPQTGSYHKSAVDIYAEYGIADAWTLGVQPSYQWIQTRNSGNVQRDSGLADTSLFVRERLWHDDYNVFSVQQLVSIPGPYDRNDPASLGYGQADVELRALYGNSGTMMNTTYFADVEGAYRKRFDGPADEVHADLTFGVKPISGFMLLAQSFNTIGMRNATTNTFVTNTGPDYDLYKLQLSGVIDVPYGISLQLGAASDIAGRNTGRGNTLFIALWRNF